MVIILMAGSSTAGRHTSEKTALLHQPAACRSGEVEVTRKPPSSEAAIYGCDLIARQVDIKPASRRVELVLTQSRPVSGLPAMWSPTATGRRQKFTKSLSADILHPIAETTVRDRVEIF